MVEDAVCNFIDNTVRESKCCSEVKKHCNKELVITKKDNEYLKNCFNCCICEKVYVEGHITGKYRDSAHSDCIIKVKLNRNPYQF